MARSFNWLFLQDDASIHMARHKKAWYREVNIKVMDSLAKSSHIDLIENLWGVLAPPVHANAWQFSTLQEVRAQIVLEWSQISEDLLRSFLICRSVALVYSLARQGAKVDYLTVNKLIFYVISWDAFIFILQSLSFCTYEGFSNFIRKISFVLTLPTSEALS